MINNKAWKEIISELLKADVETMSYDDLNYLTLAYRDTKKLDDWSKYGVYEKMTKAYEKQHGIAFPMRADAPEKAKQAYARLGKMQLQAQSEGIILY